MFVSMFQCWGLRVQYVICMGVQFEYGEGLSLMHHRRRYWKLFVSKKVEQTYLDIEIAKQVREYSTVRVHSPLPQSYLKLHISTQLNISPRHTPGPKKQ